MKPAICVHDDEWIDPESIQDLEADFSHVNEGYVKTSCQGTTCCVWVQAVFPASYKPKIIAIMLKRAKAKKAYDKTMELVDALRRKRDNLYDT